MTAFAFIPLAAFLVLIALISGRIIILKKKGINVGSGKQDKKKSLLWVYPVFAVLFILWLFEIIKPVFQVSLTVLPELFYRPLINSLFLQTAGTVLIVSALVLLFFALRDFKNSLRFGFNEKNQGKLITSGIFSITRNPFFISLDLYFLGVAFIIPGIFLICFALLSIFSVHFFILKEEKFLKDVYGEEYEQYTLKVKRYF